MSLAAWLKISASGLNAAGCDKYLACCVASWAAEAALRPVLTWPSKLERFCSTSARRLREASKARPRPLPVFRLAIAIIRCLPPYNELNMAMAERMNQDLVYEHEDAKRDLSYTPRPFAITSKDLP
jgi:hypothetical protein